MAREHDIKGIRYYDCDICGFTYRATDFRTNKGGYRVCVHHCLDDGDWSNRTAYNVTTRFELWQEFGVLLLSEETNPDLNRTIDYRANSDYGTVTSFDAIEPATTDPDDVYGVVTDIPARRL